MRKYIILFFSVLSFLFACNGGVPKGIIPPDQMTTVLYDVYLADGRISALQQFPDTLYKYGTARYLAIFKKFDTDSAQFRKSYLYYCTQPDQLLAMNAKILEELKPKQDSLRKLLIKQQKQERQKAAGTVSSLHTSSTLHPSSSFHPTGAGYGAGVAAPAMPNAVQTTRSLGPMQKIRLKHDTSKIIRR